MQKSIRLEILYDIVIWVNLCVENGTLKTDIRKLSLWIIREGLPGTMYRIYAALGHRRNEFASGRFQLMWFFFSLMFDYIIKNFLFVPGKCAVEKAVTEIKQFLEARENHFF